MDERTRADYARYRLSWPLLRAYVMTLDGAEAVKLFDPTFAHDYQIRRRFLVRLKDLCEQQRKNTKYVVDLIQKIEANIDVLPAPKKRSADGTIGELVLVLPAERQLVYASQAVLHERRSRRTSGYKVMRRNPSHDFQVDLTEAYRRYRDRDALINLLFAGKDISEVADDLPAAIESLNERYYQARALEQILMRNEEKAFALAASFPMAFIWAAGRQRLTAAEPFMIEQLEARLQEVENSDGLNRDYLDAVGEIPLLIWGLERLGARHCLATLALRYDIDWDALRLERPFAPR